MARFLSTMLLGAIVCLLFFTVTERRASALPGEEGDKKADNHGTRIALVDMGRVFKASKFLEKEQATLLERKTEYEQTTRKMYDEYNRLMKKYMSGDIGLEEKKELEGQLKTKYVEYEKHVQAATQKFWQEEARIYRVAWEKIVPEVSTYARSHGIDLVMSTHSEEMPNAEKQPTLLMQHLSRNVLFENNLDITDEIIEEVRNL